MAAWITRRPRGARPRGAARTALRALAGTVASVVAVVAVVAPPAQAGAPKWECVLTEPFATVAVGHDAVMWKSDTDAAWIRLRILGRRSTAAAETLTLSKPPMGPVPPAAATLIVRATPGGDGMSDRTFARTLEVGSPMVLRGGCELIPGHHTLHEVVGVRADDVLNVRSSPGTSGRILTTVGSGATVWESGLRRRSGSWVPVSVVTWPSVSADGRCCAAVG